MYPTNLISNVKVRLDTQRDNLKELEENSDGRNMLTRFLRVSWVMVTSQGSEDSRDKKESSSEMGRHTRGGEQTLSAVTLDI